MGIDFGYLAGLIDGDGYIAVYPNPKGQHSRVQIVISSSNKEFLEELKDRIGNGGVYQIEPAGRMYRIEQGSRKKEYEFGSLYHYIISKRGIVYGLLKGTLPHAILKKNKVLEALNMLEKTYPVLSSLQEKTA